LPKLVSSAQLVAALKCQELLRLNVDLMSICSEWFITWFAKSLPVSTVLRVWDTLFFEGFKAQLLLRVCGAGW
jgi:hypothetical protein